MAKIDIPDNVTVLNFEQWKTKPEIQEMYSQIDECDTCHGSGEHECECGDTHTCGNCDGVGKERDLREMYEQELRIEIQHLREWVSGTKTKTPTVDIQQQKERKIIVVLESKNGKNS